MITFYPLFALSGPAPLEDVLSQFASRTQVAVSGQVLDKQQSPVAGAAVSIVGPEGASTITANDEGIYRFEDAAVGLYVVLASDAEHRVTASSRMEHKWEGVTSIVTERVTIEGVVVDSDTGQPVTSYVCGEAWDTEAFRLGVPTSDREYPVTRVDDAQGRFTIPVYKPRVPAVLFRAPGYQPYLVRIVQGETGSQIGGLIVPLVRSALVRGTVVDAEGAPVTGARIVLAAHAVREANPEANALAESGADGAFELAIAPDQPTTVLAYHPGYAPSAATVNPASSGDAPLRIVLTPGGRIEGTVTRDGFPAENVLVLLRSEGFVWQSVLTDEDGHYAFAKVPAVESEVVAGGMKKKIVVEGGRTIIQDLQMNAP
ncbi:MAG: carboxypeptidase regulatory-like domain-containing protein [Candidatus Hydrogenedentes bacterium]|nr:carboxypeptidase regulatory-like domain-containing protein [Candidatus Hydrogenedentota bacterium]